MPTIAEIIRFKYPTQLANGQIVIQDDGEGPYVVKWSMGSIAKPTDAQIKAYVNDADYKNNLNEHLNQPIYAQLDEIDLKSIRALRSNDTVRLQQLEAQAVALRSQLVK